MLLGDLNRDALRRPTYQARLRTWGHTAYPTGWTWTWRGARAHTHKRSMIDFIVTASKMQVAQVHVLGRIPVRTDHRMVRAEVQIKGTYRMASMGPQPRPAQARHQNATVERMVWRWRGNVFAPIAIVNDATGAPLTGAAMMQEFARHLERKQGRPASVFPD